MLCLIQFFISFDLIDGFKPHPSLPRTLSIQTCKKLCVAHPRDELLKAKTSKQLPRRCIGGSLALNRLTRPRNSLDHSRISSSRSRTPLGRQFRPKYDCRSNTIGCAYCCRLFGGAVPHPHELRQILCDSIPAVSLSSSLVSSPYLNLNRLLRRLQFDTLDKPVVGGVLD